MKQFALKSALGRTGGRAAPRATTRAGWLTLALFIFTLVFTTPSAALAQSAPLSDAANEALQQGQAAAARALVTYDTPNLDQPLWRDAVRYGEEARLLAPGRQEPLRFLAQVYSTVGFYSRAWEAWTGYYEAGGLFDAQARRQFVDIGKDLGYAAYRAGNLEEALLYYNTVDEVQPGEVDVVAWLGRLNLERGDLAAALPYWRAAVAQSPDNRTYANYLARTQDGLTYGAAASEAFYRGAEAAAAGEQETALAAFREASSANPQYKEALVRAAELSAALRRPGDARDLWGRVLALDPNDARARTAFERASAQARWGAGAANAFGEGAARYEAGDAGAAAASFARATELSPAYAEAWAWRGRVALEGGDLENAAEFYGRARELEPSNASYGARFDQVAGTLAAREAEAAAQREAQAAAEEAARAEAEAQAEREREEAAARAAAEAAAAERERLAQERAAAEAQREREQAQAAAEAAARAEREREAQAAAEAEAAREAAQAAAEREREREAEAAAQEAQALSEAERERLALEAEAAAPTPEATLEPSERAETPVAETPTPPSAPAEASTETPTEAVETPTEVVEAPAAPEAPSAPDPTQPLVLIDTTYTHQGGIEGGPKAFSLFDLSGLPDNLSSPVNYADGTLYQRLEVQRKPSDVPVTYQLCTFQADGGAFAGFGAASQYACSSEAGLSFLYPGVYEHSQPMSSLERYGTVDWQESLSRAMLVLEDRDGNPVDDRYGFAGSWYGSPVFDLYFPMEVRYTALIVPPGGTFEGWPQ